MVDATLAVVLTDLYVDTLAQASRAAVDAAGVAVMIAWLIVGAVVLAGGVFLVWEVRRALRSPLHPLSWDEPGVLDLSDCRVHGEEREAA